MGLGLGAKIIGVDNDIVMSHASIDDPTDRIA